MDKKIVMDYVFTESDMKKWDYAFNLKKDELKYLLVSKKFDDFYKVKFLDGKEMVLDKKGSTKAVQAYVKELIERTKIDEELKEKYENEVNLNMVKEMAILKNNVEKLQNELKVYQESLFDIKSDEVSKVNIEIPDFIKDMRNFDIISIRGNKEYYRKFKRFAVLMGISVTDFMNYLFYLAMEKLGR